MKLLKSLLERIRRFFLLADFGSKAVALGIGLGLLGPAILFLFSRLLACLGLSWDPLPWILLCWAVAVVVLGSALVLKVVEGSLVRREEQKSTPPAKKGGPKECPHCGYSPLPNDADLCPNCHLVVR